jgi:hypothetical protein
MDIKNGGWEGHGQVTLIDPQEGKYERRNVNAIIAVCIQPPGIHRRKDGYETNFGSRRESDSRLQWGEESQHPSNGPTDQEAREFLRKTHAVSL